MTTLDPKLRSGLAAAADPRERAMLAHDLRGALQGVIGGVARLNGVALAPEVRAQVERIAEASKTIVRLAGGLLATADAADAFPPTVEVEWLLRHLERRWTGEAAAEGGGFRIDAARALPETLAVDLTALIRALGNVIGNALRYASAGPVTLVVQSAADGGLAFLVRDEGPGLGRDALDAAAGPPPSPVASAFEEHGLGLHIARRLCAEMGGVFGLANRPAGGAEASLIFPARLCGSVGVAERLPAPVAAARELEGRRILLAEDNPTNQMVATQMLRALGAEVTLTADGVEALERFESGHFDLVVVDIEMPRMTGIDVIRAVRARRDARARTPIVALTAYVLQEHRDRIAAAGANGLISKPIVDVEALGQALLAHLPPLQPTGARARAAPELPAVASRPCRAEVGDAEPIADLAIFDALCAAIGPEMMAELLDKVAADLLQARADLAVAIEPLDRKPIRAASHILISVAGAVGATRLQRRARALNAAAHDEAAPDLPRDVRRCIDEIDAAVAFARRRRAEG
jgi:CheY-like chemotaxis protein/HPt (histidine-containing phosphotransfer) domain-containing protein